MSSSKFKLLASANAAIETLAAALEQDWDDVGRDDDFETAVPQHLRDAASCLERGRALLAAGLRFPTTTASPNEAEEEEYRMVARNGVAIPPHVLERMRVERMAAESRFDANVED